MYTVKVEIIDWITGDWKLHFECSVSSKDSLFQLLWDYRDAEAYRTCISTSQGEIDNLNSYFGWNKIDSYKYEYMT